MKHLSHKNALSKLVEWGHNEEGIRSMILTGSRAREGLIDELSDYDIAVFTTDNLPFTKDTEWLASMGTDGYPFLRRYFAGIRNIRRGLLFLRRE